jgi:hypothetical protein
MRGVSPEINSMFFLRSGESTLCSTPNGASPSDSPPVNEGKRERGESDETLDDDDEEDEEQDDDDDDDDDDEEEEGGGKASSRGLGNLDETDVLLLIILVAGLTFVGLVGPIFPPSPICMGVEVKDDGDETESDDDDEEAEDEEDVEGKEEGEERKRGDPFWG